MFKFIQELFTPPPTNPDNLTLESQKQSLELQLEEKDRIIASLKKELDRERSSAEARLREEIERLQARFMDEISSPVQQLLTQSFLVEKQAKPLQASDVLAVVRRLVRVLEDHGLSIEAMPGSTVSFDPNIHEAIGDAALSAGAEAVVKFPSLVFAGKILRKAGVAPTA